MPNFIEVAHAYGLKGYNILELSSLITKLNENSLIKTCVLFNVEVVSNENCYPMVVPGRSNSQMIGLTPQH
jgi:acetolactate synthase-1/2/3 large subunit